MCVLDEELQGFHVVSSKYGKKVCVRVGAIVAQEV